VSAAIHLDGVTVLRDGRKVLDDVSLQVAAGETLSVLGSSGSGKTTLLRVVAGFIAPGLGAVIVGEAVASERGRVAIPPEERGIAMVFQDLALWPHLTVQGNLAFGLDAGKVPRAERDERIAAMLARVGLAGKARKHPGELSGGERQRVAIALFRELLRERGTTALYVTHDPREARALAERTAVLDAGRVVHLGALDELRGRDDLPFARSLVAALG